jgi:hypothetical protein
MRRRTAKRLTCPVCGVVVADATYQRFPGNLVLVDTAGNRLQPESVALQERRLRGALERASSPAGEQEARERLEFLERHRSELVYDLRCRNGHSLLRTMPQLVRAVRDAEGEWAHLG